MHEHCGYYIKCEASNTLQGKKKKNLYISMKNKLAPGSVWKESEGRNGSITLEPSSPK